MHLLSKNNAGNCIYSCIHRSRLYYTGTRKAYLPRTVTLLRACCVGPGLAGNKPSVFLHGPNPRLLHISYTSFQRRGHLLSMCSCSMNIIEGARRASGASRMRTILHRISIVLRTFHVRLASVLRAVFTTMSMMM